MAYLYCSRCTNRYPEPSTRWLCDCGSLLDLSGPASFPRLPLASRPPGLWRYREALAFSFQTEPVSLGEPMTPLIRPDPKFPHLFFKLEFLFPTGSFKDRGSALLISKVKELGIPFVIEDSSGNAGASIAAYCARAGVACRIFVPAQTSPGKLTQIQAYGAQLVKVEGTREHTAQVAREAAQEGYYASHSCNPYFCEGTKTFAFEIWEQMGGKAPDLLILPVGNGTLLLGTFLGFSQLMQAGEIEELPRIIGVQSQRCAPLFRAYQEGQAEAYPFPRTDTVAEGISVAYPIRGRQILEAVRKSRGSFLTVTDEEVISSLREMARMGLYLEPTSATATAAWDQIKGGKGMADQKVVIPLTGSGLKAGNGIAKLL